jgi:hypothetical protein
MAKDDKITAIIDWELAGYYTWWAERWLHEKLDMVGCYELLEPLWPRLSPNMETEKYFQEVSDKLYPVIRA